VSHTLFLSAALELTSFIPGSSLPKITNHKFLTSDYANRANKKVGPLETK